MQILFPIYQLWNWLSSSAYIIDEWVFTRANWLSFALEHFLDLQHSFRWIFDTRLFLKSICFFDAGIWDFHLEQFAQEKERIKTQSQYENNSDIDIKALKTNFSHHIVDTNAALKSAYAKNSLNSRPTNPCKEDKRFQFRIK